MSISAIIREYTNLIDVNHYVKDKNDFEMLEKINIINQNISDTMEFENIRFEDVYFKYPTSKDFILKGITFAINKGENIALIGLNGAGKTSITKLMLGLYKPTRGRIFLNDKNITEYTQLEIHSMYATMQQSFAKYKLTLGENMALYNIDMVSTHHLNNILGKCGINDLYEKCKNNYHTMLTNEFKDGIMLSGGEWQKVALARTFYSDRNFIIFDEPTAALDPLAEIGFYENYKILMKEHTCLYITHRLGAIYLFERCLVLSDGKMMEEGTHVDLMNIENGIYKRLFDKQKEWYSMGGEQK